jgi:hypothetical protein
VKSSFKQGKHIASFEREMTDRKLKALTEEIRKLGDELRVSNEQLSYLDEVAEESKVKMLVDESPLSKRNYQEASADLERHRRNQIQLEKRIKTLREEQDRLLEKLYGAS